MNDDELITAVRQQRDKIPMTTPVEQVIRRGRAVRAQRRIPVLAAAIAASAAAALAVTTLLPASHTPGQQPRTQLAAWTVTRQPDGGVMITLRQVRDPARVQHQLRADGIPARVFSIRSIQNSLDVPGCHVYPLGGPGGTPPGWTPRSLWQKVFYGPHLHVADYTFWVYPSAIPHGQGVAIVISTGPAPLAGPASRYGVDGISLYLVTASPRCTGS